ncbi:MAG: hypothetical protein AABM30_07195 [Actinomycetota bacterium]
MPEPKPVIRRLRRAAPLALVVFLAVACGDDNKGTAITVPPEATTRTVESTPTPTPKVPPGTKRGKGTLLMESRDLVPLLGGNLQRFAPVQVEGTALKVIAVAGPESFWAGRSSSRRILVKMRLKGLEAPEIKVGQKVDVIGVLTAGGDAAGLGVSNAADRALLERQGVYIDASVADVTLR